MPLQERQGAIDADTIQTVVRDQWFWSYCRMLWQVHAVLEACRIWAESCVCHEQWHSHIYTKDDIKALEEARRAAACDADSDGLIFRCPLQGCRAPQLAAGDWKSFLQKMRRECFQAFLKETQ
eukprot:5867465-Amphidinium_carterae.1